MERHRPDVIVLDLEMPHVDGLTFLQRIMATDPIPVLVCSALAKGGADTVLRALEYGAVDVVQKPGQRHLRISSTSRRSCSWTRCEGRPARGRGLTIHARARCRRRRATPADAVLPPMSRPLSITTDKVVAVGTSTGGTEALRVLLTGLPLDAPGFVVVQHMPEMFTGRVRRAPQPALPGVRERGRGRRPRAPRLRPDRPRQPAHARGPQGAQYAIRVTEGPLVARHRPSVDVLFRSVAQAAGPNAVGVLMTGMGDDGAEGLLEMKRAGAATIAQDETTSVVFGMPRAAIRARRGERHAPSAPHRRRNPRAHGWHVAWPVARNSAGTVSERRRGQEAAAARPKSAERQLRRAERET
jgi:two-component system chemotaxis response regulator CheB